MIRKNQTKELKLPTSKFSKETHQIFVSISIAFCVNRLLRIDQKETSVEKADFDSFLVKTNFDRTVINKNEPSPTSPVTQDAQAFMAVVEKDANKRATERKQRESVAQNFRK